jgi:hypothetical protein
MEQIGRGLPNITTPSDQDSRHGFRRSRCRTGDFNFFEDIFLEGADLLETNQLEER